MGKRDWLIEERKKKDLTYTDVASKAGVTGIHIYNIETGKANPSIDTAKKIAKVLDFDWTRFYD